MDLTKYYPDIAAKYPAYVTQRELCEICHICPKTAYNLEQQGEIPYTIEQNHLIRSHKIKLTDILAYLYRRECRQEADSPYICAMRTFYDEHLSPYTPQNCTARFAAYCQNRRLIQTGQTKGGRLRLSLLPMATVNIKTIFSIVPGYMVRMAFHFSLMKAIPTFPGTDWRFYWTP